ncbi:hypothetical protein ACLOJK_022125, partial [Asimina triloba]
SSATQHHHIWSFVPKTYSNHLRSNALTSQFLRNHLQRPGQEDSSHPKAIRLSQDPTAHWNS